MLNKKCNALCALLSENEPCTKRCDYSLGFITGLLKTHYPDLYFVSSTTKVLTDFADFLNEVKNDDFLYVVPDFRLNKAFDRLNTLPDLQKNKVEFLCNECCFFGCMDRKRCYEAVSLNNLGKDCPDHRCNAPDAKTGYRFFQSHDKSRFYRD